MNPEVTLSATLPEDLMKQLHEYAGKLGIPQNKILENALSLYLGKLKQLEFAQSFSRANRDEDLLTLAEEGLGDYLNSLNNF